MRLWDKLQERLKESPRTRSILLYLFFVVISAVFWSFLTFNGDVQLEVEVPVEISKPSNVHLLSKVPDTLSVIVRDRGYRFFTHIFQKTPKLTLRLTDYSDGNGFFKVDQSHLKKALAPILNKHVTIVSVLPEAVILSRLAPAITLPLPSILPLLPTPTTPSQVSQASPPTMCGYMPIVPTV